MDKLPLTRLDYMQQQIDGFYPSVESEASEAAHERRIRAMKERFGPVGSSYGSAGGVEHTARGVSYKELLTYKSCNFNRTEGATGLTIWFEKMEYVFHICKCVKNCQVKYAACTLLDGALTWWNAYIQFVELDAAYETTWKELKKMMIEEYCLRNEVQKM
ncbi:hypothetical protein Tco_0827130 [Tanacetum coccineum]